MRVFDRAARATSTQEKREEEEDVFAVLPPGRAPRQLVIFLHGVDGKGRDWRWLAEGWRVALPDAAFLFPNGFYRSTVLADGYRWWDLGSFKAAEVRRGVKSAAPALERLIARELRRYGLKRDELVLGGFSQGAMLALHLGRHSAGVLAYSGLLAGCPRRRFGVRRPTPLLLAHGSDDPIIPAGYAAATALPLKRHGFAVAEHRFMGGHRVTPEGAALGGKLMRSWFEVDEPRCSGLSAAG